MQRHRKRALSEKRIRNAHHFNQPFPNNGYDVFWVQFCIQYELDNALSDHGQYRRSRKFVLFCREHFKDIEKRTICCGAHIEIMYLQTRLDGLEGNLRKFFNLR